MKSSILLNLQRFVWNGAIVGKFTCSFKNGKYQAIEAKEIPDIALDEVIYVWLRVNMQIQKVPQQPIKRMGW